MAANITNINQSSVPEPASIDIQNELVTFLRLCFYLMTPNETTFTNLEDVPNYLIKVVPFAPLVIIPEHLILYFQKKRVPSYCDTMTSIICLILIFLPGIVLLQFDMVVYTWLYDNYNIIDPTKDSTLTWICALLLVDFGSYYWHKNAHEINFLWALHQAHHTPQTFGLHAGFRLASFNRFGAMLFFLPIALVMPPSVFYVHMQLNAIFQLWIHSTVVPSLGPLDYIINNPSLHRVHHGRNRYCIDKNYAAVLSIWDVMFGTFVKEKPDEEIFYGLVKPEKTFDVFYLQCNYFRVMFNKFLEGDGIGNKLSAIFKGPGWAPGKPRLGILEEIPEIPEDTELYDTRPSWFLRVYVLIHIIVTLFIYGKMSRNREDLSTSMLTTYCTMILAAALCMGYILEKKKWIPLVEMIRCSLYLLFDTLVYANEFPASSQTVSFLRIFHMVSAFYWSFNLKMFSDYKKDIKSD